MYPAGQGDRAERPSRSSGRCRGARATAGAHSEAHVRARTASRRARTCEATCAARTELVRRTYGVGATHVWSTCDASGAYARARRGAGAPWPLGWTRPLGQPTLPTSHYTPPILLGRRGLQGETGTGTTHHAESRSESGASTRDMRTIPEETGEAGGPQERGKGERERREDHRH